MADRGLTGRPWPGQAAARYCCYGCLNLGERSHSDAAVRPRFDGIVFRMGLSLLLTAPSMALSIGTYVSPPPEPVRVVLQCVVLLLTLAVVGLLGGPLLRNAAAELRRGRLTVEALFLTTIVGSLAASLQSLLTGDVKIYFEVTSVLLIVYTFGKLVGARGRAAALASSRALADGLSTCRLTDQRVVHVTEVFPGDLVEVRPGEAIAVDGVIRDGVGYVSEAPVSGEPFAVVRRPGDRVLAGSASYDATFRVEATAPGTARQIDRLIEAVEAARSAPTSLQAQADRLARVFVPLVTTVALVTFVGWTLAEGWRVGLFNAMSVLLVACPCSLGLATPIVLWTTLARLAERGFVVRSGDFVERLAAVDRVLFDKTGTLTEDRSALVDVATAATGKERARLLGWVALVESQCHHPVARAFAGLAPPHEGDRVTSLRVVPGSGVEAEVSADGESHSLRIGRIHRFAWPPSPPHPRPLSSEGRGEEETGAHRIVVELDGQFAAVATVAERPRESARETIAALGRMGLPVQLLTGDTAERAEPLGVADVQAGLLPEDKRAFVAAMTAEGGRPLMVGDGINDAAALAAAHAGVALSSGTDLAVGASAAVLYHDDLRALPWAVALCRNAVAAVRRNLLLAVGYNLVGMSLAAAGLLHPLAAAVLMVASSLLVAGLSTRVGVRPEDCGCDDTRPARQVTNLPHVQAAVHALAFALQGVLLALLLGLPPLAASLVTAGFAAVGTGLALLWRRWATIPHAADMAFGMLTLGNLGMLAGWWADHRFAPLPADAVCCCAASWHDVLARPGMWLGMLACANLAMAAMARRPSNACCRAAMFTGGNVGMLAGMVLGGAAAGQAGCGSAAEAALTGLAGMTVGMVAGMIVGAAAARQVLSWLGGKGWLRPIA